MEGDAMKEENSWQNDATTWSVKWYGSWWWDKCAHVVECEPPVDRVGRNNRKRRRRSVRFHITGYSFPFPNNSCPRWRGTGRAVSSQLCVLGKKHSISMTSWTPLSSCNHLQLPIFIKQSWVEMQGWHVPRRDEKNNRPKDLTMIKPPHNRSQHWNRKDCIQ